MLSGDFARKLRQVNNRIRIWCGNDDSKPAGIYAVENNEYKEICGVDKNYLTKEIIWNSDGSIKRSGWLRPLKILLKQGYIDRWKAEKVFGTYLGNLGRKNVSTNNGSVRKMQPIESSSRG